MDCCEGEKCYGRLWTAVKAKNATDVCGRFIHTLTDIQFLPKLVSRHSNKLYFGLLRNDRRRGQVCAALVLVTFWSGAPFGCKLAAAHYCSCDKPGRANNNRPQFLQRCQEPSNSGLVWCWIHINR